MARAPRGRPPSGCKWEAAIGWIHAITGKPHDADCARAKRRREHAAPTTEKDTGIRKPRFGSADYRGPRASEADRRGPCSSGSTICFQAAQTQDGATARNRSKGTSIQKPRAFRRPGSPSAPK